MKWINKIFLNLALVGTVAALVVGLFMKDDFGTWGLVALAAVIVVLALLLSLPHLLKFVTENFDVSYEKESGIKIKETPKCKPEQDDILT
jgi:membrane protein YdbS with pleckstrin-like domain